MSYEDISEKWVHENENISIMSQAIPLEIFGLQQCCRSMATEFNIVSFMTQTQYHLEKLYKNPEHFPFNRNANYMSFDPTRVTLGQEPDKDKVQNYINANLIDILGSKVIAAQAPLTSTFYNFWRMVEQYNVTVIFMLCNLIEKGKIKCDRYFPGKDSEEGRLIEREYEITLQEQGPLIADSLRLRRFKVKNHLTHYEAEVTHWQVYDWPDGNKPMRRSRKRINYLVNELVSCVKASKIPIVHCSAGVGRTGTFIAMAIIKMIVQLRRDLSIFSQVRKLREQRWGMVHCLNQYEFLYSYTALEINNSKKNSVVSLSDNSSDSDGS